MWKKNKYSNASLPTNGLLGASAANTPTATKLTGANHIFQWLGNSFRPHQTQRSDLRDEGCLLPSAALGVEDRPEL